LQSKQEQGIRGEENNESAEYIIHFLTNQFESIKIGCCDARLINEGDLNGDGSEEISVFQAPWNGCTYMLSTFSYQNGKWHQIIEPLLIPTGCEYYTDEEIQNRIFIENKTVYIYEDHLPNFSSLQKKAVTLKNNE